MSLRKLGSSLIVLAAAWTAAAHANMSVDRTILHFQRGDPASTDVTVANRRAEPLFVDVEVVEVVRPGTADEQRVAVKPGADPPLLVSPDKMVLPQGHQRLLRVVNLAGHGDRERVFRVTLRPVPPPARVHDSGIRLFVAYELLVIVAPVRAAAEVRARRDGDELVFENGGNVNVLLHSGRQCPPPEATGENAGCVSFRGKRLYPGNTWTLRTPYRTAVEFVVARGARNVRRKF